MIKKAFISTLVAATLLLLLNGCFYQNKCGLSMHYYDKKTSYYDSQGNYVEECPKRNIVDYGEEDSAPTYPNGYDDNEDQQYN